MDVGEESHTDSLSETKIIKPLPHLYLDIRGDQIPIIYRREYDIHFLGIEKLHPFDSSKWGRIFSYLQEAGVVSEETVVKPLEASEEDLLIVHSQEYLNKLKWSYYVANITEVCFVACIPNFIVQRKVLRPFRFQTGGTILAAKLAIDRGWAFNIGGGFHHCSKDNGGGFCTYADITLCIKFLFNQNLISSAMVIDLDAHQGNGYQRDFIGDQKVYIFDMYNSQIYPHDNFAKQGISRSVPLNPFTTDSVYFSRLSFHLKEAFVDFNPDIVIYNAGTDILENDRLGLLLISPEGIIQRDELVVSTVRNLHIPIVMLTSGGYQRCTARIVADSVINLKEKGYFC